MNKCCVDKKFLVLGAGPAGLQMGYFFEKSQSDYIILEKSNKIVPFFRDLPRSRQLISFNKVHTIFDDPEILLRWDWNSLLTDDYGFQFRDYSKRLYPLADELVHYLEDFAQKYHLKIRCDTTIARIHRSDDNHFELFDLVGTCYRCQVLIVATGFGKPYIPEIPGIEDVDNYEDVPLDIEAFAGQRVLIVGKGNSAFEIADVALESAAIVHIASPNSVTMAWKSRHPGHVRAHYSRLLDAYQLKTLNGVLDCHVHNITRQPDGTFLVTVEYVHADGEVDELVYDRIVRCTGFSFDPHLFDNTCRPHTVIRGRLPAITPFWESTNVPNMYFAGTLMQSRDFKRSASAFIDGFRYNIRTLHRHLINAYEGTPLPVKTFSATPEHLMRTILERACRTSGLWTQFGYLCDVFVVRDQQVTWYEELPFQSLKEGNFAGESHYYALTFEWGNWDGDVMAIERHPRNEDAHTNVFLHPIVRCFQHGKILSEHHILEDLFGIYASQCEVWAVTKRSGRIISQYHQSEHEKPLCQYFFQQLEHNQ